LPVVLHDVAELKLSALDTPESDNGITFQFADGKRSFAVGDSIRFRVRSNRGGYLTIVDLSPDGEVTLLYPNSEMDIGRFAPNTEVVLPGPADVQFPVTLPAGAGEVRAIMTDAPLGLKWKGRFATSKDDPALVDKVRRGLERLVRGDGAPWSTHVLRYSVHQ
jgi:hypothetical protein